MAIIYQKTPGQLIAQPGRAVSTFPSGIVRIDQTYICASQDADRHREAMLEGAPMPDGNSSPCTDGAFISPIPGEVDRGDGFTEFRVSGYGRSKSKASGLTLVGKQLQTKNQGFFDGYVSYKVFIISGTAAVIEDGSFDYQDLSADEDLLAPFDVQYLATSTTWTLKKQELVYVRARGYTANSPYIQEGRRGYRVTFGAPASLGYPDVILFIWVEDPSITVTSRSQFGKFSEVTFTSTRQNLPGQYDEINGGQPII